MRDFSELSKPDKLKAVLAVLNEPTSRAVALWCAGIEEGQLTREEKKGIRGVFAESRVLIQNRPLYAVAKDKRDETLTGLDVDRVSVSGLIADVMLKYWQEEGVRQGLGRKL